MEPRGARVAPMQGPPIPYKISTSKIDFKAIWSIKNKKFKKWTPPLPMWKIPLHFLFFSTLS